MHRIINRTIATSVLPALLAGTLGAGNLTLKPETLAAWDSYVQTESVKFKARLTPGGHFLWLDESPERLEQVKKGEIIVEPMLSKDVPKMPHKVPSGLIHDWIGAGFIPNAALDDVLCVVRDYPHYKENYKPVVLDSKTISLSPPSNPNMEDRFSILLMNKSVLSKTALEGEYKSSTVRLDRHRAYGITQSTRIQEIESYGSADAKKLPVDEGGGLIWRLYSIARYEERDNGVYVEVEAMVLSREIPFGLRWMVDPIVRRVSRSSLTTSIQQTTAATRTEAFAQHRASPSTRASTQR